MNSLDKLLNDLNDRLADISTTTKIEHNELTLEISAKNVFSVSEILRNRFGFSQLMDLCGVDYSQYGQADWNTEQATSTGFSRGVSKGVYHDEAQQPISRFAVVYHLLSIKNNQRMRLRAWIKNDPPRLDSVISIWNVADWYEREAFDLFGILFEGHPDLRRILTDYGFIGHPFRKDFPLSGHVEMRYDPEKKRVVYEPVSIEPRTLVPKTIRHDNRYVN
jgi:NADH-quinone oxidoreductase subunit C